MTVELSFRIAAKVELLLTGLTVQNVCTKCFTTISWVNKYKIYLKVNIKSLVLVDFGVLDFRPK